MCECSLCVLSSVMKTFVFLSSNGDEGRSTRSNPTVPRWVAVVDEAVEVGEGVGLRTRKAIVKLLLTNRSASLFISVINFAFHLGSTVWLCKVDKLKTTCMRERRDDCDNQDRLRLGTAIL